MEWVTSNEIYLGWFRNCRKLKNTCRWKYRYAWKPPKEITMWSLEKRKIFTMKLLLWSVQLLRATSSVTPIQQNLPSTSTSIQPSSSESSNKMSRGQTSPEKMEEMLENRRNKKILKKLPKSQTSTNSEEEKF